MPARSPFDYAIVRVVPRVEREEFLNVGVILHCHALDFLGVHAAEPTHCHMLAPGIGRTT